MKLKLLDDNYRKNRCLYRMSHIADYIDKYVIPDRPSAHIEPRDYDLYKQYDDEKWHNMWKTNFRGILEIEKKHRDKFFVVHDFNNVTKEAFFDYAKYFLDDDDERERIKNGIYNLRTYDGRPYSIGGKLNVFNDLMTRGKYRKEQIKSRSYDKFNEDIINEHNTDINNGAEIQNIEKQEINASENEIRDKGVELEKNDEANRNIIRHEQVKGLSKSEVDAMNMKTATDNKSNMKLNKRENLVNRNGNNEVGLSEIKNGEPNIERIENNNVNNNIRKDNKFGENIAKMKVDLDINHGANINNGNEIQNVEKQEANASEDEIRDKDVELEKNDKVEEPSKFEKDIMDIETITDANTEKEKIKNIMTVQKSELSNTSQQSQQKEKQTVQKHGFGQFLRYILIWLGNKIKLGLMTMKNFVVSLIVKNISKPEFDKTVDTNQNESKNIGYNNRRKTEAPRIPNKNNDISQYQV